MPSMDADGNGLPNEDADNRFLKSLNPVIGRAIAINPDIPVIEMISDIQDLYGQTSAEIIAGKIQSNSDIISVWAFVNAIGGELNKNPLELKDDNNDGIYSCIYANFLNNLKVG